MDLYLLSPKHDPRLFGGTRRGIDVVAIHGLNGHHERTWTDPSTGVLWLRDLLPGDLPDARIFSFSYDSRIFSDTIMTINDYALRLLGSISSERTTEEHQQRPIFLVCHSLGGLVAKKALIIATHDLAHRNTADMTKGIAFFGTPHSGSLAADKAGPVFNILKMLHDNVRSEHLRTLGGRQISEELFSISQSFRFLSTDRVLVSMYETRPMPHTNLVVVPKESALTNLPNEVQIPRNADHRALCRFTSRDESGYGELLAILRRSMDDQGCSETGGPPRVELSPEEARCFHALYISEYENHKAAVEKAAKGTCQWIFDNHTYVSWLEDPVGIVLWISGGAGTGKSVLASSLVDTFRAGAKSGGPQTSVCYHFFSDRNSSQRVGYFALCSILHQLISANQVLIKHVLDAYQKKGTQITRDLRTLWEILVEMISDPGMGRVVLVLDALEECAEESRQRLLDWIVDLSLDSESVSRSGRLKVILTSRPEFSIQTKLRAGSVQGLRLEDDIHSLEADIKTLVTTKLGVLGYSKGLSAFVFEQLIEHADSTFLWISLILRLLEESGDSSHRGVVGVLKGSSRGADLFNVYRGILDRIPPARQTEARQVLRIVASTRRPLTLNEFNFALAIDDSEPADGTCDLRSRLQDDLPRFMLRLCGPFIRIVDGKVHLVHQTAKEFLFSASEDRETPIWTIRPAESNLEMAKICIWYLLNESTGSSSTILSPDGLEWVENEEDSDGIFAYAAAFWPVHFKEAAVELEEQSLIQDAIQLHELASIGLSAWFDQYWAANGVSGTPVYGLTPLITASITGQDVVVQSLLDRGGEDPAATDEDGRNALLWACRCGNDTTASLLLNSKLFDLNGCDNTGCSALWWAVWGGHIEVASLLLKSPDIDVNDMDQTGRTPLHIAAWFGYDGIFTRMLAHPRTKTDVKDHKGWTALTWAAWRGRQAIVRQLVLRKDVGAAAASQDRYRRTPLARACEKGHTEAARLLLRVSDPVVRDREQRTPLSLAAQAGKASLVQLLLADPRAADRVDEPDESGQTPLFWAASEGHEAVVEAMVRWAKAMATATAAKTTTTTTTAPQQGKRKIKLIDIDSPMYDEQTPLSIAAENGHLAIVRLLHAAGASPASRDMDGKTPLWWASSRGRTDVVRFLLGLGGSTEGHVGVGVNPNVPDEEGKCTPLIAAVEEGHGGVVQELLAAQGRATSQTTTGPAGYGGSGGGPAVQVLARNAEGKTAIQVAAESGQLDIVSMLLEDGRAKTYPEGLLRDAAAAASKSRHPGVAEVIWMAMSGVLVRGPLRRGGIGGDDERRASEPAAGAASRTAAAAAATGAAMQQRGPLPGDESKPQSRWTLKQIGRRFT